jgi:hypothetical protein
MTTLRRFTLPTQTGILHVQESIQPDEVLVQIEYGMDLACATVSMTSAQFRELCRLGIPAPYDRDQDTVRFQPTIDPHAE